MTTTYKTLQCVRFTISKTLSEPRSPSREDPFSLYTVSDVQNPTSKNVKTKQKESPETKEALVTLQHFTSDPHQL